MKDQHATAWWLIIAASAVAFSCIDFDGPESQFCDAGGVYCSPPAIVSITPNAGPRDGGTAVSIKGAGFNSVSQVHIGPSSLFGMRVIDSTTIVGAAPALPAGAWDVSVTTAHGSAVLPQGFVCNDPPVIASITPNFGSNDGGTIVTIAGVRFIDVNQVSIGPALLLGPSVVDPTTIIGVAPALPSGSWDVSVATTYGTSILPQGFTAGHTDGGLNYIFVTSTTIAPGSLGGTPMADAICRNLAADAGLPGSFIAWLPSSAQTAQQRLGDARSWYRPDGRPSLDTINGPVFYAPARTEHGAVSTAWAFTGLDGTSCAFWTASSGSVFGGFPYFESEWWDGYSYNAACSSPFQFYCLGVDQSVPLRVAPPASARRAFVTSGLFQPSTGGIAAADALCQAEAQAAGLSGTFLALLSTSTASAASRFSGAGPNWYRPDNISLFSSASALLSATSTTSPLASPSRMADGGICAAGSSCSPWGVWTGADSPSSVGGAYTCADWTRDAGSGFAGVSGYATTSWFAAGTYGCNNAFRLYCFQQ